MSLNGKPDGFTVGDFRRVGEVASLKRRQAEEILGEVVSAVESWPELAASAGVEKYRIDSIRAAQRLSLPQG
jgi:hypothetical protein